MGHKRKLEISNRALSAVSRPNLAIKSLESILADSDLMKGSDAAAGWQEGGKGTANAAHGNLANEGPRLSTDGRA